MAKKKKPVGKKKLSLRQMLDQLDRWLLTEHGCDLAKVLSALRGPDSDNDQLKEDTTAVIRGRAFPRLMRAKDRDYRSNDYHSARHTWIMQPGKTVVLSQRVANTHFGNHIVSAARALGLTVKRPEKPLKGAATK